jgi:hypothetical protein
MMSKTWRQVAAEVLRQEAERQLADKATPIPLAREAAAHLAGNTTALPRDVHRLPAELLQELTTAIARCAAWLDANPAGADRDGEYLGNHRRDG